MHLTNRPRFSIHSPSTLRRHRIPRAERLEHRTLRSLSSPPRSSSTRTSRTLSGLEVPALARGKSREDPSEDRLEVGRRRAEGGRLGRQRRRGEEGRYGCRKGGCNSCWSHDIDHQRRRLHSQFQSRCFRRAQTLERDWRVSQDLRRRRRVYQECSSRESIPSRSRPQGVPYRSWFRYSGRHRWFPPHQGPPP